MDCLTLISGDFQWKYYKYKQLAGSCIHMFVLIGSYVYTGARMHASDRCKQNMKVLSLITRRKEQLSRTGKTLASLVIDYIYLSKL